MKEYNRQYWEGMYHMPLEEIPWEIKEAPVELREAVATTGLTGGKALDAGCGTGNYSVFLARHGFNVIGVDYSEEALKIARDNNEKTYHLPIAYIQSDLTSLRAVLDAASFDLILDYRVLHHLPDGDTETYAEQCVQLLKPDGRMIIICNSEKDIDAQGDTSAVGKFGNTMHYRTREEILALFNGLEELSYKEVILGKKLNHAGHCFILKKP